MSPYKDRKPRFVREWYIKLRQRMKELKALDDQREKLELEQQEELPIQGQSGSPTIPPKKVTPAQTVPALAPKLKQVKGAEDLDGELSDFDGVDLEALDQ